MNATVISPAVHVLCVDMAEHELQPLVYEEWPNSEKPFNASNWPSQTANFSVGWINHTNVDELFGFSPDRPPPVFPTIPLPYNIVLNETGNYPDALYILAAAPVKDQDQGPPSEMYYTMCSLSSTLESSCSTIFHYTSSGGNMTTDCDENNGMAYHSTKMPNREKEWVSVAGQWALAIGLKDGISNGDASNARLLTQLIPKTYDLNSTLPSIAEALVVLAGCTLLVSAVDAPLDDEGIGSLPKNISKDPILREFQAQLRVSNYASGATMPWQNIFFLVLFPVFIFNVFCLAYTIYLARAREMVPDYIEPQSLFTLALKSPPSQEISEIFDRELGREQVTKKWHIRKDSNYQSFITGSDAQSHSAKRFTQTSISDIDFEDSNV